VLLFGVIGLQIINPQILRRFIDTVAAGSSLQSLTGIALLFLTVALGTHMLTVATVYVGEDLAWRATNALRADLTMHCLRLDMAFHNVHTPGELVERIDGDVGELSRFFSRFVIVIVINILLFAGVLLVLFLTDWRIGLAAAGLAVTMVAIMYVFRKPLARRWEKARQASAAQTGFLEESLASTEDIRSRGAGAYMMQRFQHVSRENFHKATQAWLFFFFTAAVVWTVAQMGPDLGLAVGIRLFQLNTITLGTIYAIMYYTGMVAESVDQITSEAQNFQRANASIDRIRDLFRTRSNIREGHGVRLPPSALPVEFQSVSFEYVDGENVLRDVSFRLEAGRILGLLGRTGSGKSTLARLLFRLYDPTAGTIRLGDVDVREARLAELRQRVGMVTQEVQLFQASLRDNLTLFDRSISYDQILQALRELELWEWYQSLPAGLETCLGSGGARLSAGEAQLLAFARVLLKDPGLIVLDEASSRLDPLTEQRLERAVERLLRNRTGVIIAHRLSTIQRTEEVMILDGGRICEHGPRAALAGDPTSRYSQLLRVGLEEVLA
jgi:ABC-type multidrug transport system fused ATPase/permease subunit